jgi:hypothetical protein
MFVQHKATSSLYHMYLFILSFIYLPFGLMTVTNQAFKMFVEVLNGVDRESKGIENYYMLRILLRVRCGTLRF